MKPFAQPHVETLVRHSDAVSASSMLIRLSGALALVILIILAIAWLARRSGWGQALKKGSPALRVRHSLSLGQRERIAIVEAGNRWFLLGITPEAVTLLSEIDKDPEDHSASPPPVNLFQQALLNATRKKGKGQ